MRIIQGRDYYDSGMAYGSDNAVVFVREKDRFIKDDEFVGLKDLHLVRGLSFGLVGKDRRSARDFRLAHRSSDRYTANGTKFSADLVTVVFCGNVYHGIRIETDPDRTSSNVMYHWHKERFQEWMAQVGVVLARAWWEPKVDLDRYFSIYPVPKRMLDWLIEQRIVIAIRLSDYRWAINSNRLREVQFFRVLDAYSAFQEIAMWVGGVLPSAGNPMVAISDVIRIEKHGFDKVTSFRNMK